jgi:hypothetical protein
MPALTKLCSAITGRASHHAPRHVYQPSAAPNQPTTSPATPPPPAKQVAKKQKVPFWDFSEKSPIYLCLRSEYSRTLTFVSNVNVLYSATRLWR